MADDRQHLRADCSRCAALCCVAPAFAASADFALDKPAGVPCPQLRDDLACSIHDDLRGHGFPGCAVFDCFGAGQHLVQVVFGGRDWRADPGLAQDVFSVFTVARQVHELLWYLAEGESALADGPLREQVRTAQQQARRLLDASAAELAEVDTGALRAGAGPLLEQVSCVLRGDDGRDRRGADLVAARLRGADLRGDSLRGALLIGADLRGADLTRTDLLGADLRGADVRGARLAGAVFLTQPQVDAARGDAATTLPPALTRPRHWPAGG